MSVEGAAERKRILARLRRKRDGERRSAWYFFKDLPRIFPYVRPYWKLALGSVSVIGFSALMSVIAPWPLGILLDTVLAEDPAPLPSLLGFLAEFDTYTLVTIAVVGGLIVTAASHALGIVDNYFSTKLEQRMVLDLRSDMFKHAQQLSLAFHDQRSTGTLMYQINNQANAVGAITVAIPPLVEALITLVAMFAIAYVIDPQLALVALAVVPFIYYSAGYYAKRIEPHLLRVRSLEGESLSIIHEAMAMLRVIVSFGREDHEFRRFRRQGEQAVDARVKVTLRQTAFSLGVNMITAIGTAGVLAIGAVHVINGSLTPGELTIVLGYIAAIYGPLEQISLAVSNLQENFIGFRHALALLETEPEVKDAPDAVAIRRARGDVAFENVSFSYAERKDTLKDISFEVAAGTRVAIVGPTGAGKSTLMSLLMRFYEPRDGRILLDGRDIRTITTRSLREQISIVLQDPLLASGSIEENIRYGDLDSTDEQIVEAARAAGAHEFISGLPKGYDTEIGERGVQLSGGERQRISVARAFRKDAPILILDEPTSSIDSKTEAIILDALDRLMEGRTTFMIAHRLATVRQADLIFVLNHGELVERGTHEELLERDGLYKQLHDAQVVQRDRRRAAARAAAAGDEPPEPLPAAVAATGPLTDEALGTASWALFGALSAAIRSGSQDALRTLAARTDDPNEDVRLAARLARALLDDLTGLYEILKDLQLVETEDDWPRAYLELLRNDPFVGGSSGRARYVSEEVRDLVEQLAAGARRR